MSDQSELLPVSQEVLKPCPNPWCVSGTRPMLFGTGLSEEERQWVVRCGCGVVTFRKPTEAEAIALWNEREPAPHGEELLNDISVMMSEFVDNWPQPKKVSTALALIAKTLRAALDPPKHKFWGAGEADCPGDIKAANGELHTLRCKRCGIDNPRDDRCTRMDAYTAQRVAKALRPLISPESSALSDPHRLSVGEMESFQARVDAWMDACFGATIKADVVERCDRFIEEALEFVQAAGYSPERAHALVDYTFGRPLGEINQEVGGVMVTLAAMCNTLGVNIDSAAETELARVWTKVEQIRAKQAAKPTGSALPCAALSPTDRPDGEEVERR